MPPKNSKTQKPKFNPETASAEELREVSEKIFNRSPLMPGDRNDAIKYLEMAINRSENFDPEDCFQLARKFEELITERNFTPIDNAIKYYEISTNLGHDRSCNNLGVIYQVVKNNITVATTYYEKAAGMGNTTSQANFGAILVGLFGNVEGYEIPDFKRGIPLLKTAAELGGSAAAASNLKTCYQYGIGVDVNEERVNYYEKLVEENSKISPSFLQKTAIISPQASNLKAAQKHEKDTGK